MAKKAVKTKPPKHESFTYDDLLNESPDTSVGIRMVIPKPAADLIDDFQKAYKERFGRKGPTKEMIVWKLISHGADGLLDEIKKMES